MKKQILGALFLCLSALVHAQEANTPREMQSDDQVTDLTATNNVTADNRMGIGTRTPAASMHVSAQAATPAVHLGGTMFYNSTSNAAGTAILNYFSDVNNRQIMFADSAALASTTLPGIRFMMGGAYASIDAATPIGAYAKNLVLNANGGNIGIGITAPAERVHIVGTGVGSTAANLLIQNTTTLATHSATAMIQRGDTNGYAQVNYISGPTTYWAAGLRAPDNAYHIHEATANVDRVVISSTGLSVNGNIDATGVINARFQDIAEWVPATEPIAPGTVVVVAPDNHVMPSASAYDTAVAGVVSPQPGIALGERGASKVLVATTGRVKVRVDASHGAVREGDVLVSSPTRGTAMKSTPLQVGGAELHRPGTIIGKALQPLEKGVGEILVLLSLQ